MNIFEGGRRIAKVVAGIFVIPACFVAIIKIFNGAPDVGREILGYTFGCFATFWILVAATGWIIRGFMGIPKGSDYHIRPINE